MRTNVVNAHGFEVSNDHILKPLAQMPPLPPQQVEPIAREQEARMQAQIATVIEVSTRGASDESTRCKTFREMPVK